MEKKREIELVVNKTSLKEAEDSYLFFWADKDITARFKELKRLKQNYWKWKLGTYPEHIEKVVAKIKR